MKPLIVLLVTFGLSCLVFFIWSNSTQVYLSGRIAMAVMMVFTSVAHFVFWRGMTLMIPPFIPNKKLVVYITGVLEVVAGIGLLIPTIRYNTAVLLILFFALLLPANIYAAQKNINLEKADYTGSGLSYLWFRIPLQLLFIGWVWYFAILN